MRLSMSVKMGKVRFVDRARVVYQAGIECALD